jgi:4-hydroxybenzoate polyprenyltransferase
MPQLLRLVHPAPALAVTLLSVALAAILGAGSVDAWRILLVGCAVAGSQVLTGALNDWADRDRDAASGQAKPIPAGLVAPRTALRLAAAGLVLQVVASAPLGPAFLLLGLLAAASAVAYDLWLSRTPLSVIPYLFSFGVLPIWVAAGVEVPFERVAAAVPLAATFAAAAHLANTLRDWEVDAGSGSRSLAQTLGRRTSRTVASALSLAVGIGVGVALLLGGRLTPPVGLAGGIGLAAVSIGAASETWLWRGQLVAAVAWTVAWALSVAGT